MNRNTSFIFISIIVLLCFLIVITVESNDRTKTQIETLRTEIIENHALLKTDLVEIRKLLEMFEEATPTGKEVIYLDEDTEDWLNNDMITGYVE